MMSRSIVTGARPSKTRSLGNFICISQFVCSQTLSLRDMLIQLENPCLTSPLEYELLQRYGRCTNGVCRLVATCSVSSWMNTEHASKWG